MAHKALSDYIPTQMLVIYEDRFNDNESYIEKAPIQDDGKPGTFAPMQVRELQELGKSLFMGQLNLMSGMIPKNLLFLGFRETTPVLVWETKETFRHLYFDSKFGVENTRYKIPRMLWKLVDDRLHLFAIKEGEISDTTKLYKAPFPNTDGGYVCWGNIKRENLKYDSFQEAINKIEIAFFNTSFTHFGGNDTLIKGNFSNVYKTILNQDIPYPEELLIESKQSIQNVFKV